jgi:hypothetical protein
MKYDEHQVRNVGELENSLPSQVENAEIVVDDGNKACNEIQGDQVPVSDQRLLSDEGPRGVADSHENGLESSVI